MHEVCHKRFIDAGTWGNNDYGTGAFMTPFVESAKAAWEKAHGMDSFSGASEEYKKVESELLMPNGEEGMPDSEDENELSTMLPEGAPTAFECDEQ